MVRSWVVVPPPPKISQCKDCVTARKDGHLFGASMITLKFTVDEVNFILSLLGRLPFAEVHTTIRAIAEQGQPQAEALMEEEKANTEAAE